MTHTAEHALAEAHTNGLFWWVQTVAPWRHVINAKCDEAMAIRLRDCWNACAGIPDPAQLRADRDALLEALEESQHALAAARAYIIKLAGAKNRHREECMEVNAALISRIRGESE